MNDIDSRKTKRILDELLATTEIKVYNLSENAIQAEMRLSQIKEELQRMERQLSDIVSILRGLEDD